MAAAEAEVGVKTETPFVIRNFVEVKLAWPRIYPTTEKDPFTAFMRIQLVEEAEKLQREFIGRDDENQEGDQLHEYDTEMLALLSVKPPTGFPDFPVIVADPKANKELYQQELADASRRSLTCLRLHAGSFSFTTSASLAWTAPTMTAR
jgi:hypothetical protein